MILRVLALSFILLGCNGKIKTKEPLAYKKLSSQEKREYLWSKILESKYKILPKLEKADILGLLFNSLKPKMDSQSDFSPIDWKKSIHKYATVAKIRFVPIENQYDGIFAKESLGLLRVSLTYDPETKGIAPGIALKLFSEIGISKNVSLLTSLDNQGQNYNIFKKPFTNIVKPSSSISAKIVAYLFKRASKIFNGLSVKHFGTKSPFQIFLMAREEFQLDSNKKVDFRKSLSHFTSTGTLFDVYALDLPKRIDFETFVQIPIETKLSSAKKIGELVLDSEFVASQFGDSELFFQHEEISL